MPAPFRVLLVGAGDHAVESRGPSLRALAGEGVELIAIASPSPDRRERACTALRLERGYASLAEALAAERPDGVLITAPNHLHEALTLEALAAGAHVLCEKPMALDAAGGRRMLDAAQRAGRVLAIGYQYPYAQPLLAEPGVLDGTFRVDAHWTRADGIPPQAAFWDRPGSGAGEDLLGHLLSVVRAGVAGAPAWATALSWSRFGRAAHGDAFAGHDTLEALVAFAGGVGAHLLVSWAGHDERPESLGVTFAGATRTVTVPLMGAETDVERFRPTSVPPLERPAPAPHPTEMAFVLQARDWVAACRDGAPLRFDARAALDVQAILDAVLASAATGGRRVEVEG